MSVFHINNASVRPHFCRKKIPTHILFDFIFADKKIPTHIFIWFDAVIKLSQYISANQSALNCHDHLWHIRERQYYNNSVTVSSHGHHQLTVHIEDHRPTIVDRTVAQVTGERHRGHRTNHQTYTNPTHMTAIYNMYRVFLKVINQSDFSMSRFYFRLYPFLAI